MRGSAFAIVAALALVRAGAEEAKKADAGRKPIVDADIFHGTVELLSDIYGAAYDTLLKDAVATHGPKVRDAADQLVGAVSAKAGMKKDEIYAKRDKAFAAASDLKTNAVAQLAMAHGKLDARVEGMVARVEAAAPRYAGVLPKTTGGIAIFASYCVFVLYVLVRSSSFLLRGVLSLFCCICCCGCCRGGKPKAAAAKAASGGKKNKKKA
eukprot:TRINITY_DN819_c4_g1_i1.p3 TRINITY_DN819_c4_g1~~TRINITY_DN819_c4_g1_i1.p3  ORF type:complete len:210 (-),score=78.23 TRINITY_DN819_c4_g1_i1:118-747(-)